MKVELELKNGRRKAFPEAMANMLVKRGIATYATRDMRAAPVIPAEVIAPAPAEEPIEAATESQDAADGVNQVATEEAPYGYKADGTPRKRPGRSASVT